MLMNFIKSKSVKKMVEENNKKFNLELDENIKAKLKKIIVEKPILKNKRECKEDNFVPNFGQVNMTPVEAKKAIRSRESFSSNQSSSNNNPFFTGINSYSGSISRNVNTSNSYAKSSSSKIGYSQSFAPSGSAYGGGSSFASSSMSPAASYAPAVLQTRNCCGNGCCPIGRARLAQGRANMMNKY